MSKDNHSQEHLIIENRRVFWTMATVRIIIATVLGAILLVAGLSIVSFVNNVVTADDGSSHHKSSADHGSSSSSSSSSESRYNVIESTCSTGSIITTEGTNRPDQMFGC